MKTVLSIHAHPDDAEILAGGTLALAASAGHRVVIITMTPGDCGSAELGPEEIAAIRRQEAGDAAALIGAEYRCAEFRDISIFNDDASRRRVTELLRSVQPDIVLTSSPADYMCDHEATSVLVRDACFAAPIPNFLTHFDDPAPPLPAIPHLYYMDAIEGNVADFYVDVSEVFDTKREMLSRHRSQREWLRKHHGMDDYLIQMERWCRSQGGRAGVEYAEGFRQYKGHAYPDSPLLQELMRPRTVATA